MTIFYSPSRRGFFDPDVHQRVPEDGVRIRPSRHRELLAAQEQGAQIVPDREGRPELRWPARTVADRRAELLRRVKGEARRRIDAISPTWRQLNDLRDPTLDGAARFAAIDAIRAASAGLEEQVAGLTGDDLNRFAVRDNPDWPPEEPN